MEIENTPSKVQRMPSCRKILLRPYRVDFLIYLAYRLDKISIVLTEPTNRIKLTIKFELYAYIRRTNFSLIFIQNLIQFRLGLS